MTTILDALRNADINLNENAGVIPDVLGKEQLHNAVGLLNKGYQLHDDVDRLIEEHVGLKNVPDARNV